MVIIPRRSAFPRALAGPQSKAAQASPDRLSGRQIPCDSRRKPALEAAAQPQATRLMGGLDRSGFAAVGLKKATAVPWLVYPTVPKECHGDRSAKRPWPEQPSCVPDVTFDQQGAEWSHLLFLATGTQGGSTSLAMTV